MGKDTTQFDSVLSNAVNNVMDKLRDGIIVKNGFDTVRRDNLGDYFAKMYKNYENMAVFNEYGEMSLDHSQGEASHETAIERDASKVAYSSVFAMKTIFNLCIAKDIKDEIDKQFAADKTNPLCKQLKDYVDEKLEMKGDSPASKNLTAELKKEFESAMAKNVTTSDFLSESFSIFQDLNDMIDSSYEIGASWFRPAENDHSSLRAAMFDQIKGYAGEIKNHVVCPLKYPQPVDSEDQFSPDDYVKKVNKGEKLTTEESRWAQSVFESMCYCLADSHSQHDYQFNDINLSAFSINGNPLVTREEWDSVKKPTDVKKLYNEKTEKLVAAAVSGDEVTCNLKGYDAPVRVHPEFNLLQREEEKNFFMRIIDYILDKLGFSDNAKMKKLNEKLSENDNQRSKTSFSELAASDKVAEFSKEVGPRKTPAKDAAKEKPAKEISSPEIH